MDILCEATILNTLDANLDYWQLGVQEEDKAKTALCFYDGLYQFTRMPFRQTNEPASFQRSLDTILARYKWKTCLVYINDVIIFSSSIDELIEHVDVVLEKLRKAGISKF